MVNEAPVSRWLVLLKRAKGLSRSPLGSIVITMDRNLGVAILGVALSLAVPSYWKLPL